MIWSCLKASVSTVAVIAMVLTVARPAVAQSGDTGFVHDRADQAFLVAMIADGRAEMTLAEIAQQNSTNAGVRALAADAAATHLADDRELAALAHAKDIHPRDGLDPLHQEMCDRLITLRGAAFDREYLQVMARLHAGQVDLLDHERSAGLDAELRAWAARTIERSRTHLERARDLSR